MKKSSLTLVFGNDFGYVSQEYKQRKKSVDQARTQECVYIAKKEKNTEWQKNLQLYIG